MQFTVTEIDTKIVTHGTQNLIIKNTCGVERDFFYA
jgi:hypothetical protein